MGFRGHIEWVAASHGIGGFVLALPAFIVCSLPFLLFALTLGVCVSVLCDVIYLPSCFGGRTVLTDMTNITVFEANPIAPFAHGCGMRD